MNMWPEQSNKCFTQFYQTQYGLFKEAIITKEVKTPPYLEIKDIYESHFLRQRTFKERIPDIKAHSKYTLNAIAKNIGDEKILSLVEEGTFPREVATGMSYFFTELTKSLQAPEHLLAYILNLRSTIGCCDDYIDKDRYYIVYGENLFLLSHFMLSLGEISLTKIGELSEEKCNKISELNIEMIAELRDGDEKSDIFKKSYPQGYTFAKIVGLFSPLEKELKDKIAEAAGYYDLGSHIVGEVLDMLCGEKSCLNKSEKESFEEAIDAYSKALELCPENSLKECIQLEKALMEELCAKPDELEKMVQKRKKTKREYPQTIMMKIKNKNAGTGTRVPDSTPFDRITY